MPLSTTKQSSTPAIKNSLLLQPRQKIFIHLLGKQTQKTLTNKQDKTNIQANSKIRNTIKIIFASSQGT